MTGKLKVLDLFSGIGGMSLGLERTGGFTTAGFCELKPHARAVLAKNFPGVPCHDDVTTYEFREGEADVITAGFPCQDISFAGLGAGLAGARSGLYREVVRALRLVRPGWALLENVAALLSRGLGTVLGDLAAVGYDAEWHCIPASAVGAPHRRDRVWIVAHARGEQHEGDRAPLSGTLAAELSEAYLANTGREGHGPFNGSGGDTGASGTSEGEGNQRQWLWPEFGRGSEEVAETPGLKEREPADEANTFASGRQAWHELGDGCEPMAYPNRERSEGRGLPASDEWLPSADAERRGARECWSRPRQGDWWATEPDVGRVAHGVPARMDRLEELGNAVVPQIPEILGRAILRAVA